jgi:hypothetical protein
LHDVRDARRVAQIHIVELFDPAVGVVPMAIDQSGRGRPPVKIDDLRIRADMRANFGVRSDREKSSVEPDGHRFHDGIMRIDGQNFPVEQNGFRRRTQRRIVRHSFGWMLKRRHPSECTDKYCR